MSTSAFERLKVLIVEDNLHMRNLLRTLLNSVGIQEILEANHGGAALELLREKKCDLVLSDLAMKPMGGHGEPVEKGIFTAPELLRYSPAFRRPPLCLRILFVRARPHRRSPMSPGYPSRPIRGCARSTSACGKDSRLMRWPSVFPPRQPIGETAETDGAVVARVSSKWAHVQLRRSTTR